MTELFQLFGNDGQETVSSDDSRTRESWQKFIFEQGLCSLMMEVDWTKIMKIQFENNSKVNDKFKKKV